MDSSQMMHQGVNKLNSGDIEGGMKLINEAISLDPNDPEKLATRAQVYGFLKKPVEAIIDYKKAIKLSDQIYQYHFNLGNVYMDFRQFQEAYDCFSDAALINPNDPDIYSNRGSCLIQLSRRKEAYNDYTKALQMNPNDNIARNGLNILVTVDPSLKK